MEFSPRTAPGRPRAAAGALTQCRAAATARTIAPRNVARMDYAASALSIRRLSGDGGTRPRLTSFGTTSQVSYVGELGWELHTPVECELACGARSGRPGRPLSVIAAGAAPAARCARRRASGCGRRAFTRGTAPK